MQRLLQVMARSRQQAYYCHACDEVVAATQDARTGEVACTQCGQSFLEELDLPGSQAGGLFASGEDGNDDGDVEMADAEEYDDDIYDDDDDDDDDANGGPSLRRGSDVFPDMLMRNLLMGMMAAREATDGSRARQQQQQHQQDEPQPRRVGRGAAPPMETLFSHFFRGGFAQGDYVNDGNIDQLLARLFGADAGGGPTPTAKSAIDAMPRKVMTRRDLNTGDSGCVVCQDTFEEGKEYVELPCKHRFHEACIKPWLESNNTCPTCRHELPVEEDEDSSQGSTGASRRGASRSGAAASPRRSLPRVLGLFGGARSSFRSRRGDGSRRGNGNGSSPGGGSGHFSQSR